MEQRAMQFITSREYKLILSPDRFLDRERGVEYLADVVERLAKSSGQAKVKRRTHKPVEMRETHYLDTADYDLSRAHLSLRCRSEEKEDGVVRKLTLKFRTPDWVQAMDADLSTPSHDGGLKFEEDILPEFRSAFSRSNTLEDLDQKLEKVGDLLAVFPGIEGLGLKKGKLLERVRRLRFTEPFHELCSIRFGKGGPEVEVGVSFWYSGEVVGWPDIAELTFDYKADGKKGAFHLGTAEGAKQLFLDLQQQPGWCDLKGTTKTRFAYGQASTVFDRTL